MRMLTCGLAFVALSACTEATTGEEDGVADVTIAESEVDIGDDLFDSDPRFRETAWEWKATDGTPLLTALDASGTYRTEGGGDIRDEGRWQVREDQLCLDSDMLDDEPGCFSADAYRPLDIGDVWLTENKEGEDARFTRAAYRPIAAEAPGT